MDCKKKRRKGIIFLSLEYLHFLNAKCDYYGVFVKGGGGVIIDSDYKFIKNNCYLQKHQKIDLYHENDCHT